jgi:hypothetical protein
MYSRISKKLNHSFIYRSKSIHAKGKKTNLNNSAELRISVEATKAESRVETKLQHISNELVSKIEANGKLLKSHAELLESKIETNGVVNTTNGKLLESKIESSGKLLKSHVELLESKIETKLASTQNILLAKIIASALAGVSIAQAAIQFFGGRISINWDKNSS